MNSGGIQNDYGTVSGVVVAAAVLSTFIRVVLQRD